MFLRLLTMIGLIGVIVAPQSAAAQDKKPNILVIWGDDIGLTNISFNNRGMMGYKTPNIDRIAKEGVALPITTASNPARRGARRLSAATIPSARA
jgi:arylsulfatase